MGYNNYNSNQYGRSQGQNNFNKPKEEEPFNLNINWFDKAKKVIENNKDKKLTYTQLRNMLSVFNALQEKFNKNNNENLTEDEKNDLNYVKIKLIYMSAKGEYIDFYKTTQIEQRLEIINTKKEFKDLLKYIEALVAYHKFIIGK